jgi:UDP-N-acetylglucosamine transferase subunit ALG13
MSILVTVGAQVPFERLVDAVDGWAKESGRDDVFAQVGETTAPPKHIAFEPFLTPAQLLERVRLADLIVGHAGMGTIITALQHGKPIIVMPRSCELGEHRNEHQLATATRFAERGAVTYAKDEADLVAWLGRMDSIEAAPKISPSASPELIQAVREFVVASPVRRR